MRQDHGGGVFEVERTPSSYTWAPGHYQQNVCSRNKHDSSLVEQGAHAWWKRSSFSKAIENIDYDAPGKMNTTQTE